MDGQNGIFQAELDPATLKPMTPFKQIWSYPDEWNEGPHLYKLKGKYFLLIAAGGNGGPAHGNRGPGGQPLGPL